MTTESRIETGALGYQHPGWEEHYYPEGLPEDWLLDYYSHHFRFVLLKTSEWIAVSEDEVRQWKEDVKESFDFFLSIQSTDIDDRLVEQVKMIKTILGEQLRGVVIMQSGVPNSIQSLLALTDVYIDTDTLESLPDGARPCWRKGREIHDCVLGFLDREDTKDIRTMRAHIQTFMTVRDPQLAYLVYEGEPPPSQLMQDAQVILQLLM